MFTSFTAWVDSLLKAAGHKYIKRIPYQSQGKMRYRYIYNVTHMAGGKHVLDPEHMVVGAAFQMEPAAGKEVHAHITKVEGDMVTYRLDDGPQKGETVTESKAALAKKLNEKHGVHEALAGAREKQAKVVADLKARGASDKQVAREQARLERLSVSAPAPKSEESKKRAAKKPKSAEPAAKTPKSAEPAAEGREGTNAERRTMAFFDHPDAMKVMQRLGLKPDLEVGIDRDTLRYAYDVESVKTTKQTLPYGTTEGVTEHEYNVLPQFDNPMFALYVEDERLVALAKSGEKAGQKGDLSPKLRRSDLRVLLHTLASDPQAVAQFAGVKDMSSLLQFKGAVESVLDSDEHRENVGKYDAAPTQDTRRHMAAVAQLLTTNIEQQHTRSVQNTTGEYASDAAIPKSLQTALKRFVSKDKFHTNLLKPFRRAGHMYATDGMRAIRLAVQSAPTEEGLPPVENMFAIAQGNKPTATLDASTAKSIADVCKDLGADVPVEITTMGGKTMFRAGGVTFATVDSHTERAPMQYVSAKYLADMLSVEHPITILQNPDEGSMSALSAHTANTQQLLMPRRY